jgi:hypothetical protein
LIQNDIRHWLRSPLLLLTCCAVFLCCLVLPASVYAQAKANNDRKLTALASPGLQAALSRGATPLTLVIRVQEVNDFLYWIRSRKIPVVPSLTRPDYGVVVLSCTDTLFTKQLLPYPGLLYADLQRGAVEESSVESVDLSLNSINLAQRRFPLVNGNNLVVSVKENRFDTADIDFRNRIQLSSGTAATLSSHATAMTTIIGGAGNSYYKGKGVAPQCLLNSTSFSSLVPEADSFYLNRRVLVQNHSYGTGIENYYGIDAEAHDRNAVAIPGLLHVYSSGNSGLQTSTSGVYSGLPGFANQTSNAKMAKNILTVGATDSFGVVAAASSKGPAYDGRVKPELVAMGEDGSSGAAALVSGSGLLVHQAFQMNNGGTMASSAMIKAILLNSATDTGSPGIDFSSGYGQLDLHRALQLTEARQIRSASLTPNQQMVHTITLPPGVVSFKATLVWTDPPAPVNAAKALVNDLDLSLITPGGQEILPWVLSSFPQADSLRKAPRRMTDTLNNIEQVTLDFPAAGQYQLKINARKVPAGPQAYALAYSFDTASLQIVYPQRDDAVLAGSANLLRWQSTTGNPVNIDYSLDGNNWLPVATAVSAATGYRYWVAPDTFAVARLRFTSSGLTTFSDSFVISRPLSIAVGFNCPDSFMFYWPPYRPGTFVGWRLGATVMEPFVSLTDTLLLLPKAGNPALHYAVSPLLPGNRHGIRSFATNYTTQGTDCYIRGFTAFLSNTGAELVASIATSFRVKRSRIIKVNTNAVIAEFTPAGGLIYTARDNNLQAGINRYVFELELTDGRKIRSNVEDVYYPGTQSIFVFPTPLARGQYLNISTAEADFGMFSVYDNLGRKLLDKRIVTTQEKIATQNLPKGVLFYRLLSDSGKVTTGKIVLN